MNTILAGTHEARDCALFIDLPDQGWTMWGLGHRRRPSDASPSRRLAHASTCPGSRPPCSSIHTTDDARSGRGPACDMLAETGARPSGPPIDQYLQRVTGRPARVTDLRKAA